MKTGNLIPVIFNVHVEPDLRVIKYKKTRWNGYENLHEYMFKIRTSLEQATGASVKYNWLFRLDPQIQLVYGNASWAAHQYKSLINEALAAGDELGVHVHSWRPMRKWLQRSWFEDFSDNQWIEDCVDMAHQAFLDAFRTAPKSFAFGDHYMSKHVLSKLQSLGYRCDATMYPNRPLLRRIDEHETYSGWLPSYLKTPRKPFKPSYQDFTRPIDGDAMSIWELPITVGTIKDPRNSYINKIQNLLLGIPFEHIPKIVEQNLALPDPYLLAEMRTDVRMDALNRRQFDQTMDYFMHHPLAEKMRISTVSTFADQLDTQNLTAASSLSRGIPTATKILQP